MKKRKSGAYSRRKGHSFEREVAIKFRSIFPNARRQLEYHADDARGVDIQGTGRWKIQCKKFAKYAPLSCIGEVQCDRALGDVPVLVTAGNNLEPLAALPLWEFLDLVRLAERGRDA